MSKRIVIRETSGLWRIVGVEDDSVKRPEFISGAPPLSLIRVRPRYVLYHECHLLPAGQFNDFHPQQV